jgi:hypothetical protein
LDIINTVSSVETAHFLRTNQNDSFLEIILLGGSVATYRLYTKCDHCNERHPLPFGFSMERTIRGEGNLIEIFENRRPPKSVISIIKNRINCPNTGNELHQADLGKIFLVPTGNDISK